MKSTTIAVAVAALVAGYVIAQPPRSSGPVTLLPPHSHVEHGWGGPHPSDYRDGSAGFPIVATTHTWAPEWYETAGSTTRSA
jgi:hypothetical protein